MANLPLVVNSVDKPNIYNNLADTLKGFSLCYLFIYLFIYLFAAFDIFSPFYEHCRTDGPVSTSHFSSSVVSDKFGLLMAYFCSLFNRVLQRTSISTNIKVRQHLWQFIGIQERHVLLGPIVFSE